MSFDVSSNDNVRASFKSVCEAAGVIRRAEIREAKEGKVVGGRRNAARQEFEFEISNLYSKIS